MRKTWTSLALQRLNPDLPMEAIDGAVEEVSWDFFFLVASHRCLVMAGNIEAFQ